MIAILTMILFIFSSPLWAAFEFKETGARAVSLGGAYTALSDDSLSPFWNPAGVKLLREKELSTFYAQVFSVMELAYMGSSFACPTPWGGIGLAFSQFGPETYRERQLLLSHGIKLSDNILLGYSIKGMSIAIAEYGSGFGYGVDVGILARLRENVHVGLTGKNMNRPRLGEAGENLPYGISAGILWTPASDVMLSMDLDKMNTGRLLVKGGIEWAIAKSIVLRAGAQNAQQKISGGIGAGAGFARVDYAYSQSSVLPGSHQITVSFRLK